MKSSKSIRSRWLVVFAILFMWIGVANADRKRVVVLDFDGPKAEKFHADVVKLLKKSHTVLSSEKWNGAAEELDAAKVTEKNVKKIAKKLKVDAVITGKIDKRRDEYIIKLKLRSGISGELTGNSVQTKAEGPRLDGQAQRDIKDELVSVIDEMESNRGGGGGDDDGEDEPKKKKKKDVEEEVEEDEPKKSGFSRKNDDDDKKKKKKEEEEARKAEEAEAKAAEAKAKEDEKKAKKKKQKDDEEAEALATKKDEEEDKPKKRKKADDEEEEDKPKKRKASAEDGEDGEEITEEVAEDEDSGDAATNLSPAFRAVDAVVGLSFTARNLKFTYASDLGKVPPGYRQSLPVAGALVDLTVFPLAFGHKRKAKDILQHFGVNILYDQVLVINSRKRYLDGQGTSQTADLSTKENRWLVGAVFRYPLGTGPKAIVVGGSLSYGKQTFSIAQQLPNMESTDIPNVAYSMITPTAFVRFPITPKIIANLDASFHAITNTGAIQTQQQYGAATVSAYSIELGGDYMIARNLFARAAFRYQAIGLTFKGDPMSQTHTRDTDPEQDVTGAKDSYLGGSATVGYLF